MNTMPRIESIEGAIETALLEAATESEWVSLAGAAEWEQHAATGGGSTAGNALAARLATAAYAAAAALRTLGLPVAYEPEAGGLLTIAGQGGLGQIRDDTGAMDLPTWIKSWTQDVFEFAVLDALETDEDGEGYDDEDGEDC